MLAPRLLSQIDLVCHISNPNEEKAHYRRPQTITSPPTFFYRHLSASDWEPSIQGRGVLPSPHFEREFEDSGYLVGERGPEMFFPRMGGHMVPNNAMAGGGAVTINNNYDFSNADESVAARLAQTAETIKQETFSHVFGAIEHGGRFAKATGRRR